MATMRRLVVIAWIVVGAATAAWAQGVQTGTLTGTVTDSDGLPLPGASVTVTSPALQGERSAETDANGVYVVRDLPPGDYRVAFALSGMRSVEATQRLDLGRTTRVDMRLDVGGVSDAVTVTAERPSIVTSITGGANYRAQEIDRLASPRTIQAVAELAPGLSDNTPNANQLTISGGFAYDNQFLIDGVDVGDNIFSQPNALFIEDALEEVQVLTSGISAEYGRFGGGVVNAVTKSGGNTFAGSFRDNLYKPSWTNRTPFEEANNVQRVGDLQQVFEWTLGGPVRRDRVWFFHAGRRQNTDTPSILPQTGLANVNSAENNRLELKGTATVGRAQTFSATFIRNNTDERRPTLASSIDPSTRVDRQTLNNLWVANWRGVASDRLFATAQVSQRRLGFRNVGGTSRNILDSPFQTRGFTPGVAGNLQYSAPYFDATDPEDRDNTQIAASATYFLTTPRAGTHDIKGGYENFETGFKGGNSQTSTDYVFNTDYVLDGGRPLLGANQRVVPNWLPGLSRVTNWVPTRGATLDIRTQSFYVHDRWAAHPRLTLDLGFRYERVRSEATGGIIGVDTDTSVPRLGVTWDPLGTGSSTVQATYGRYAGRYSEAQFTRNTSSGSPNQVVYEYRGPAGQGLQFAPAFDLGNYVVIGGSFPLANVTFEDDLSSPVSNEYTLSYGLDLQARGSFKATYVQRAVTGVIEDFIDDPSAAGKVTVIENGTNFGTFDRVVWRNSDIPTREYRALVLQGQYRPTPKWTANAHWTVQLRNNGSFEGEAANQPGAPTVIGDFPELYTAGWVRNNPEGRFNDFQRHKVRAWTSYLFDFGSGGSLDASALWRYNSGLAYSLTATSVPLTAIQTARNPGYARAPASQTLFFGERGTELFEGSQQVDLAFSYRIPVFRSLRPWLKTEIYNVFNTHPLVASNIVVTVDPNSPLDADGLPTGYIRSALFGTATGNTSFPRATNTPGVVAVYARTVIVSFGVRF